jgi:hypothetical protein
VAVNVGMDGSRRLGRQGRHDRGDSAGRGGAITVTRSTGAARSWQHARPMAMAHRSKPLSALQSTKLDKVFTYGIVVTRGTRFAHHGMVEERGGGWQW